MFASKTILEHVLRGIFGAGVLWLGFGYFQNPVAAIIALPLALLAFRGCPMCWLAGLFETVVARLQGKTAPDACTDFSCALRDPSAVKQGAR